MSELVYLYGFVPPDAAVPPALAGVADRPVRLVVVTGARAAVSDVPAHDYAADRIEARLDDLEWVAAQGLAHEQVVAWFVDHADIAPAPLFTLYSSTDALRADAAARAEHIAAQLDRCRGRREWDIKLSYDAESLRAAITSRSAALRALDEEIAGAATGRRFLLDRKRARLEREERHRYLHDTVEEVLDTLRPHAEQLLRMELPRSAGPLPVVLHAALLVRQEQEPALRAAWDACRAGLAALGMNGALSGPWAPYRFLGAADE